MITIWELVYRLTVDVLGIWKPYVFPSPIEVFKTFKHLLSNNILIVAIIASMQRIIIGYLISLILGIVLGLVIVRYKYIDENVSALILGIQTLPSICWLPFAVLWFGLNDSAILFVTTIGSTFAITIAIQSGIKNVNPLYIRAAKTMGANGLNIYWNVIMPASLPTIVSGMKQGWSFAWRALMAGEMLFATVGLGQVLIVGRDVADISQVVAVMIVIILLGLLVDKLIFGKIEANIRYRWGLNSN
ncbi:UNVERIFIED_CONTAM: NitT/TauT family transport system permease protein [Acetivibrio alkalicellulosi]